MLCRFVRRIKLICPEIIAPAVIEVARYRHYLFTVNGHSYICTTAVGAATALKSREQVLTFLENNA